MTMQTQYSSKQRLFIAILVNAIIALGGMSTDIYLPSLPAISMHFLVDKGLAQLTVTAFVIALGCSQLIAGPIADSCGRKKLLLGAFCIEILAIIAVIFSPTIYWMLFFRFIQGVGAAFMLVPARAVLIDVFASHELKKQINYNTICFALGPIIAPFIGGYLQYYFGWQANFIFLLCYCLLVLALLLCVFGETKTIHRTFAIQHFWENYRTILSNKHFVICSLFVGIIWGYTALFNVASPFLIQSVLQQTPITFGHIALAMGIAWFIGNMSNRILFHVNRKIKTQIALWISFITIIVMIIFNLLGYFNVPTLTIPTFIIIMLSGFMFPIYVGEGLTMFTTVAASANACLFATAWMVFGSFTIIATFLKMQSLLSISLIYLVISLISLTLYYSLLRRL